MPPFSISCFKAGSAIPANCFFILSKGYNTGRPSFQPNPNCFVFNCDDPESLQQYYWLVFGLWQGKRFHEYLVGSVVLFIHIRDLKSIIAKAAFQVRDIDKVAARMQKALQFEEQLEKQLKAIREIKRGLIRASIQ